MLRHLQIVQDRVCESVDLDKDGEALLFILRSGREYLSILLACWAAPAEQKIERLGRRDLN